MVLCRYFAFAPYSPAVRIVKFSCNLCWLKTTRRRRRPTKENEATKKMEHVRIEEECTPAHFMFHPFTCRARYAHNPCSCCLHTHTTARRVCEVGRRQTHTHTAPHATRTHVYTVLYIVYLLYVRAPLALSSSSVCRVCSTTV